MALSVAPIAISASLKVGALAPYGYGGYRRHNGQPSKIAGLGLRTAHIPMAGWFA